jgi:hypothetical protein
MTDLQFLVSITHFCYEKLLAVMISYSKSLRGHGGTKAVGQSILLHASCFSIVRRLGSHIILQVFLV